MKQAIIKLLCEKLTWVIVFIYIFWLVAEQFVNKPESTLGSYAIGLFLAIFAIYFSFYPARYLSAYFKNRFKV